MKRTTSLIAAVILCLIPLAGCDKPILSNVTVSPVPVIDMTATPTATVTTATPATQTPTPAPTPTPTLPGLLPQDVYARFERVGFAADGAAPSIAKWMEPIRIQVSGAPNAGDRLALNSMVDVLKSIKGMPEINYVTEGGNIVIGYVPADKGKSIDALYNGTDSAQGIIKMEGGTLQTVHIILTDAVQEQALRDAALARCFFNGFGLMAEEQSGLADSILSLDATTAVPSEMDWLMLKLLYGADILPGMTPAAAMVLIRAYDPSGSSVINREELLAYFNEVGFYWPKTASDGIISKWGAPIRLQITGTPSEQQRLLLDAYIARLNGIEGFPGFDIVQSGGAMVITYQPTPVLKKSYAKMTAAESCYIYINRDGKKGAVTQCTIGVATDVADEAMAQNQFLRLLMRSLGFSYTSGEYKDSIFNYSSSVQQWSQTDWKMVELLYRGDVKAGEKRAVVMKRLDNVLK